MEVPFSENLNNGRFETWTTKPQMQVKQATQVHGTDIVSIETLPCEADGLVVSWEEFDQPLAIKTADCMPIVIEGEKGVVFLHAGWKGLADGILKRPEVSLISPQRVFIGPSIHECCFEVSSDFLQNFPDSPFFVKTGEKLFFNLQEEAKRQLRELFPSLLVQYAPICTCCNHAFHSYRRNKTTERNWNLYIKG
ncbi:MAG: polyphenol oxidase family protein [Bacteriovoracaceae bacterium]|nr:polyphenol oxidase family protein [Bacteriovoracaceae bacterium]